MHIYVPYAKHCQMPLKDNETGIYFSITVLLTSGCCVSCHI